MSDINPLAVLVSAIVAFALSGIYYTVCAKALAQVSEAAAADDATPPWKVAAQLGRSPIVATVVTGLVRYAEIDGLGGGLLLGAALWIDLPVVLWTGAFSTRTRRQGSPPSTPATGCRSSSRWPRSRASGTSSPVRRGRVSGHLYLF